MECIRKRRSTGRTLALGRKHVEPWSGHPNPGILHGGVYYLCLLGNLLRHTEGLKKPTLNLQGVHVCWLANNESVESLALATVPHCTSQCKGVDVPGLLYSIAWYEIRAKIWSSYGETDQGTSAVT